MQLTSLHRSRIPRLVAALIVLAAAATPAAIVRGQPPASPAMLPRVEAERVSLLGRAGGLVTSAIPLGSGAALAAEGSEIVHLDFAAATPHVLVQQDLGHGLILDVVRQGQFFYALTEEGLVVLADSGGLLPQAVAFTPGSGQSLGAAGRRVAIAARAAGLRVVEITPEGAIASSVSLRLEGESVGVTLSPDGERAYVAAGEAGVHVIDLSDLAAPRLAATLEMAAPADSVALSGALLVVGSGERLLILDPNGGHNALVGRYAPLVDGRRVVVGGDYLYVADATDGLKVFQLAAVDRPVQVYGEVGQPAMSLWLDGDELFVAGEDSLRVLDVGTPGRPLELARLELPGTPEGLTAGDGAIYAALGEDGIAVIDATNRQQPRLRQRIQVGGPAHAVLLDGSVLYAAAGEAGLAVLDIDQNGRATLHDALELPGPALDVGKRGTALYVAGGEAGLLALDVTFARSPTLAGVLTPADGQAMTSISIQGKRAYLADGDGVTVADISIPASMGRLTHVDAAASHVAISGVYLYVVSGGRITVYDARATAEPVLLAAYRAMGATSAINATNGWVYVSGAGEGPALTVLDVSSPSAPAELASTAADGHAYRAWIGANEVWLARGYSGVQRYAVAADGRLSMQGEYSVLGDAAHLAQSGANLLVGGRSGWALLEEEGSGLPSPLSQTLDGDPVRALARDGDTVATASGDAGLGLYRIADGAAPERIAQRDGQGPSTGVALDDRFVYAADAGGLAIYDRLYLQAVNRVLTPAAAVDVALRGNLAYLPLSDGQLAIIDLADPTGGMRIRDSLAVNRPTDLVAAPDGAIYGLADDSLVELQLDDPAAMATGANGKLRAVALGSAFAGDDLWAIRPGESVQVYDVTYFGNENPRYERTFTTAGLAFAFRDGLAYAAYGPGGMGVLDAATGEGHTFYDGAVSALTLDGDTLFALGDSLTAWDVTTGDAPRLLAELPMVAPGRHVGPGPEGTLLLGLESGLSVARWDGRSLTAAGQLPTESAVDQSAFLNGRAYLALHDGGLLAVDLEDPANPFAIYTFTSPSGQFVQDLLVLDDDNLLVSWEAGIDVLDVSAVSSTPRLASVFDTGSGQALDVTLADGADAAALALGEQGVMLLSLADPLAPQISGLADTPGDGQRVALAGETLYVADGRCGLRVLDVSQPESPRERGYWRSSYASDVVVSDERTVYVAEANQLLMLAYDPDAAAQLPPIPRQPAPSNGAEGVPLDADLGWGPAADPCAPLTYDVYLGLADDPPFAGRVTGEPALSVAELDPLRTYRWWVQATDRQGDVIQGPVWQFTTTSAGRRDTLPPAPEVLLDRLRPNLAITLALIVLALVVLLGGISLRRRRRARRRDAARPTRPRNDGVR